MSDGICAPDAGGGEGIASSGRSTVGAPAGDAAPTSSTCARTICDECQRARRGSQHRARPARGRIAARIEQPPNSLRQLGCEEHTRRQRRCRRTLLEIGELRQTHSEAPCAAGDVHGIIVAGDLAFDLEPPADPPHSRMQAGDAADGQLNEPCVIVPPLHVRPLVQDDLIEFVIGQTLESLRRHRNQGGTQSDHRSGLHATGQDEPCGPAV